MKVSTPHAEKDLQNIEPKESSIVLGCLVCSIKTINIDNILSNSIFAKRFFLSSELN